MNFNRSQLKQIYSFITRDFESTWNALARISEQEQPNRGNYMFALQVMILLELVFRTCVHNPKLFNDFVDKLEKIEPKYFSLLPNDLKRKGKIKNLSSEFQALSIHDYSKKLIWIIYDVIRNGHAHQYN